MLGFDRQSESSAGSPAPAALVCLRLAHGLLHDLRSPMMAISGFADVLTLRHSAELGPDARRCVESIVAAARRLEGMLELLASQTRLAAGVLEARPLDLRELLRGLPGSPELEPCAGLPLLLGDALLLREAFAALLEEARGGSPEAGGARPRIELAHAAGSARVSIQCPGAPRASVELELARRALELHGGTLRIESRADGRTVLEVELPAPEGP
jgi:signal transduction histidine kinase